jgi:hypothetical protein
VFEERAVFVAEGRHELRESLAGPGRGRAQNEIRLQFCDGEVTADGAGGGDAPGIEFAVEIVGRRFGRDRLCVAEQ